MKKYLIIAISIFFILTIFGCGKFQKEISISKTQIQEMLDKKFPIDKNSVFAKLTLASPNVYLGRSNIGMKLNYFGNFFKKKISGFIDFNGEIIYKQDKGAFYLANFNIVDIKVNKSNFLNIGKLKTIFIKIIDSYLDDYPVYRLNQADIKENIAKFFLKDVKIQSENLILILGV